MSVLTDECVGWRKRAYDRADVLTSIESADHVSLDQEQVPAALKGLGTQTVEVDRSGPCISRDCLITVQGWRACLGAAVWIMIVMVVAKASP